ncbi:aromatic ring-hydroxylating oxygenase subunit alpha [Coralliovum pocilloporae]|uniref:aromatic ring-hydroxylating oxygenase subunit alpha n=1 Tax=Coralliovum pocilloporae TaxID=3066369 RepID=UPI003307351C
MKMIDKSVLEAVMRPVNTANGLPNEFYTDEATFAEEKQSVFFDNWAAIGFAKDIPESGDAMPVNFLGQPLLALRNKDGNVRVYENICRHRGMILVEEPKKITGAIRCAYHSWCYDLDGKLRATPHVGGPGNNTHEDVNRDQLGLNIVRSHVWMDIIFVNVSGTAPAFEDYAAHLLQRWKEFDHPIYHGGPDSSFKLEIKTNWKLAVENYCESYHLPWVHPGLNAYSRIEDHYNINEYGHYAGQGTVVYNPTLNDDGKTLKNFPDLSSKWDTGAEYIALFPNVLLGVHRDHTFAIILEAIDMHNTVEHVEIYYTDPEMLTDDYATLRQQNAGMWKGVFVEDIFVVEGMQRGRSAHQFDGGRFSPVLDTATHCFHHWVASRFMPEAEAAE